MALKVSRKSFSSCCKTRHITEKLGAVTIPHLAKSSHERSDLAVVRRVHVSTGVHQELDHVEMTAVCSQPERSVSFLVSHIDVGTPAQRDEGEIPEVDADFLYSSTASTTAQSAHLLMSSSQNL